jgi:hypothetical protein
MTERGQIVPLNVRWSERLTNAVNIQRYVLPLIGCECAVCTERGYVWTGWGKWIYQHETNPLWQGATSMQANDETLWK